MYAVITAGGRQERVVEGQRVEVDLLSAAEGDEVSFPAVLLVDGDTVLATPDQLNGAAVTATVVGHGQGSQDQRLHLQAADQPAPPLRAPPEVLRRRDHQHLGAAASSKKG